MEGVNITSDQSAMGILERGWLPFAISVPPLQGVCKCKHRNQKWEYTEGQIHAWFPRRTVGKITTTDQFHCADDFACNMQTLKKKKQLEYQAKEKNTGLL